MINEEEFRGFNNFSITLVDIEVPCPNSLKLYNTSFSFLISSSCSSICSCAFSSNVPLCFFCSYSYQKKHTIYFFFNNTLLANLEVTKCLPQKKKHTILLLFTYNCRCWRVFSNTILRSLYVLQTKWVENNILLLLY